jgi:predicted HNH restriction endonuclease
MRYTESDLVIPTLRLLKENPQGLDMTYLIDKLTEILKPQGKDNEVLANRKDTYFSQKVRNLKSHDTLTKKNLATYNEGVFKITLTGEDYLLRDYDEIVTALQDQGFGEEDRQKEFENDYKGIVIEEGTAIKRNIQVRKRSQKLTVLAKQYFLKNGMIPCCACFFDFLSFYGEMGRGYIEIHHTHPIHEHDIEGEREDFEKIIKTLLPLCSNCHRMVHRDPNYILSLKALQEIIKNQK